jgi:hypothetical protein
MILHNVHSQYKYKESDLRANLHFILWVSECEQITGLLEFLLYWPTRTSGRYR